MEAPAALAGPLPEWQADEIALLLRTEGIDSDLERRAGGVFVLVAGPDRSRAARIVTEEYPQGLATPTAGARATGAYGGPTDRVQSAPVVQHRWFGRGSWIVVVLSMLCTAIFVAEEATGGSETRAVLLRFGASRPAHVRTGEWWRLVTALFVHIGPRHLLGNVAALLVLGPALASALGAARFALVYVLAGAAGNAVSYMVAPSDVVSAGASGAILGVLGALAGQRLRFAASARYRGWQVIAALLAYLAIAVGAEPGVDTMAHLGGLAAGFALGLVLPPAPARASARERVVSLTCGTVALLLVLAAFRSLVGVWTRG